MKLSKCVSHEEVMGELLQDEELLAAYLDEAIHEGLDVFLVALGDAAKSKGMTDIAMLTKLNRESLYKALSKTGNPKLITVSTALKALGLRLSIEKDDDNTITGGHAQAV